jgi:hypothetical protein
MNIKRLVASTFIGFSTIGTAFADTAGMDADNYWKRTDVSASVKAIDAQATQVRAAQVQAANKFSFLTDYNP